jgi:hypothetical protein
MQNDGFSGRDVTSKQRFPKIRQHLFRTVLAVRFLRRERTAL